MKPRATLGTRNAITEYDLESNAPLSATWNCSSLAIIRYQDRDLCPVEDYVNINRGKLDLIRKVLRAEDWNVNTTLGCIVPTPSNGGFSCYSTTTSNPPLELEQWSGRVASQNKPAIAPHPFGSDYTFTGAATAGVEYRYWTQNCGGQYRECVNFATFCYKQQ